MSVSVTRRLDFDAAHRVTRHESKCRHVHGHRYGVEITVSVPELDDAGRVVDFGAVKEKVGGWIDRYLDHGYISAEWDHVGHALQVVLAPPAEGVKFKVFTMPAGLGEPTAENIARLLIHVARKLLPHPLIVVLVRVYETPNCWADASAEYLPFLEGVVPGLDDLGAGEKAPG